MDRINTPQHRYSSVAIALHWIMAVLIIGNWFIPILTEAMAEDVHRSAMGWHKAIGITVLLLAVVRIAWRIVHPRPPLEPTLRPWERALAKTTYTLFYILIVAIPVAGWIMVSAGNDGIAANILGIGVPTLPIADKSAGEVAHEMHEILAFFMAGLVVLHVAGALKHHFVDSDGTLARMVPFLRR